VIWMDEIVTARGPSNIAFIKYWTKSDLKLNLPNNSNISMTLGEDVSTVTSVLLTDRIEKDTVYINGELQVLEGAEATEKSRFMRDMLVYMRDLAKTKKKALVVSKNNFPTSSGLASSASGGATLVFALNHALGLGLKDSEVSIIARRISGSACRSLYGGIVKWNKGKKADGSDSFAEQVVDENYWPDLIDIVAIVDSSKKKISSSEGHAATVATSPLIKARLDFAEKGVKTVIEAVKRRDFPMLGEAIMRDSNDMHAIMLDTYPPIIYLTDASRDIIYGIHELNKDGIIAAYTFDAGPNAHIITTVKSRKMVLEVLKRVSGVRKIIETKIGKSPAILGKSESLIDVAKLAPK
jgi:diphosphomevalonate decarboxylase